MIKKPLAYIMFAVWILMLSSACSPQLVVISPTNTLFPTASNSPTLTITHTQLVTAALPTRTVCITLSSTPEPQPDLPPGTVNVPILLYHHVALSDTNSKYYVSPQDFEDQIALLHEKGYHTITIAQLAEAIHDEKQFPGKTIAITFDDGDLDVYENAFPILSKYGYIATFYVIAQAINTPTFVTTEQLIELVNAGWEIGCHSMTHANLTETVDLNYEMYQSKVYIEKLLDITVQTFAYPYGAVDERVFQKVIKYGYKAGSGLGKFTLHSSNDLYYLYRILILNGITIDEFNTLLGGP